MKPFFTKATTDFDHSIIICYEERKNLYPHWHYHDEYELVFIHKGSGIRYIGDSINPFYPGDLILLGSGLPHIWINEKNGADQPENSCAVTIIHFQRKFIHNDFFELPLLNDIKKLFIKSSNGIKFNNIKGIESNLKKIEKANFAKKVIEVLTLLDKLSHAKDTELLSHTNYSSYQSYSQSERTTIIHNYIAQNFRSQIKLKNLAELVHMTPPAFCNYFKNKNRKPVFTYINDLRIGYSCKILIEKDLSIEQIAYMCGYNNTTFFNRKFKEKQGMTPKEYRKRYNF